MLQGIQAKARERENERERERELCPQGQDSSIILHPIGFLCGAENITAANMQLQVAPQSSSGEAATYTAPTESTEG